MATDVCNVFREYLDGRGLKYTAVDDRATTLVFNCSNAPDLKVWVIFNEDGRSVTFRVYAPVSFKDNLFAKGLIVCNELNRFYRWVRFYLDKDQDLAVEYDALIDCDTAGPVTAEIVHRMVGIIDEAYPKLMLARFS